MLTFTIEGLDELEREWKKGEADLVHDLALATLDAANDGITEAQRNHPYTDRTHQLTETAHAEPNETRRGEPYTDMVWPMEYAKYVDEGTSRSRPFPFRPQAEKAAQASLTRGGEEAAEKFCDKLNR